jgi:hypothetical protein
MEYYDISIQRGRFGTSMSRFVANEIALEYEAAKSLLMWCAVRLYVDSCALTGFCEAYKHGPIVQWVI